MGYSNLKPLPGDQLHDTQKKILQQLQSGIPISGGSGGGGVILEPNQTALPQDAFGRLRMSLPVTLFGTKQDVASNDDQWTYNVPYSVDSDIPWKILTVAGAANQRVYLQTRRRFAYQPGKSQQYLFTFLMSPATTGITQRVGAFDVDNGMFLEHSLAGTYVVIRSGTSGSPVDNKIAQADWNIDKLDGTGPSGLTLDLTKVQIFTLHYEWLGVGSVFFGFFIDGTFIPCHTEHHANRIALPFTETPNLPVRYEIANDGTGVQTKMYSICASVNSESGASITGHLHTFDRAATGLTTLNDADLYPLVAMRLRTGNRMRATVRLDSVSVTCTSTTAFWRWALLKNPSVAGTALSYSSVTEGAEAAVGATNATKVSGGTLIASGYAVNTATNVTGLSKNLDEDVLLGYDEANTTRDIIVLAAQRITGTTETFYGGISFRESL